MSRSFLYWILLLLVAAVVVGSLLPDGLKGALGLHGSEARHRLYHFLVFGGTALLGLAIARDLWQRVAVAGSVFALGVALEVAQYVYYDNPLEWWDIRDDGLGVLVAVLGTWLANYLRARAATNSST